MNGNDRGTCVHPAGHTGSHSSKRCTACGVMLSRELASTSICAIGSGLCRKCGTIAVRMRNGTTAKIFQVPNSTFTFICGCSGVLPDKGVSSEFAIWQKNVPLRGGGVWQCRIASIIGHSRDDARNGHFPIDPDTPHSVVRRMMGQSCYHCEKPIDWASLGRGKTPHLDHDHLIKKNNINGFSHYVCNPQKSKNHAKKLMAVIVKLQAELKLYRQAEPQPFQDRGIAAR
jgi:hypothetical protein